MSDNKNGSVEEFGRDLIRLGGVFDCDDEGYITDKIDADEPVLLKVGTSYKRIMILKETITDSDAVIINPLNENIAESVDSKWFYNMLSIGLAKRIVDIARHLAAVIRTEQGDDEEMKGLISVESITFAARHKEFDTKVLEAFEIITKQKLNFVNVYYVRKLKEARFRCSIYDPATTAEFPQVTKKAWKVITHFISDLLELDKDIDRASEQLNSKYAVTSDLITVPKLESTLKVFDMLYSRLNRYLELCPMEDDDFVVDIPKLDYHILNISEYYKKAKWFSASANTIPDKQVIRTLEGHVPTITSNIPSNTAIPHQSMVGYTEPESGIPSNPARRGIEYAQPMQQQMQPQQFMNQGFQQGFQQRCIPVAPQYYGNTNPVNYQMGGGFVPVR